MNILITGISGFIGSHIAEKLLNDGHSLFAPIRKESEHKISHLKQYPGLNILTGNFYDPALLRDIESKIDVILHFASIRGAGMGTLTDYSKINVGGTQALLDFAKDQNVGKFIYCSTVGVLGSIPKKVPAAPDDKPRADGLYHHTKYESEKRVLAENSAGLKTCVLRPTITYGLRDDGFIPKMISMVARKKLILPTGTVKLHLLDVKAFATLVSQMIPKENWAGKIYHVADKQPVILRELVNKISIMVAQDEYPGIYRVPGIIYTLSTILLTTMGMQKINTSIKLISRNWYYDIQKTVDELNYQPVETLTSIESVIDGN